MKRKEPSRRNTANRGRRRERAGTAPSSTVRDREKEYQAFFQFSPVALWVEDASTVKRFIDDLKRSGITDLRGYFTQNPGAIMKSASLVRIIDVNRTTLEFYRARSKKKFLKGLGDVLIEESFGTYLDLLDCFSRGKKDYEGESALKTFDGEIKRTILRASIVPGYEQSWAKIIVFEIDITEKKKIEEQLRKSEQEFRRLVENANSIILRWDPSGRITFANPHAVARLGYPPDELLKKNIVDIFAERKRGDIPRLIEDMKRNPQKFTNMEHENIRAGGGRFWVAWTNRVNTDAAGNIVDILSIGNDITSLKETQETLRRSEAEFRTLVENSPDVIARFDRCKRSLYVNPVFGKLMHCSIKEFIGKTDEEIGMPKETAALLDKAKDRAFETGQTETVEFKASMLTPVRYFQARIVPERDTRGRIESVLSISRDITERKAIEEKMKYISFHDRVTGLYNRTYFEEELRRLDTARELPLSIIMGDMNNLKMVNDAFGHAKGDQFLSTIARVLKESCRDEDIVARWGGDEFIVLLPRTRITTALQIASRIRADCVRTRNDIIPLSIALGISSKISTNNSIDETVRESEDRMYRDKIITLKTVRSTTIAALLHELRNRNYENAAHLRLVFEAALDLGRSAGLSFQQLKDLRLLAAVHDIGKAAVPPAIVLKDGPLDPGEWNIMKRHSDIGYRILKAYDSYSHIAESVLAVHENWDGSGYPKGLRRTAIPLLARILAVAESYVAMGHPRPYRPGISPREAVRELERSAGHRFEPRLVELFLGKNEPVSA